MAAALRSTSLPAFYRLRIQQPRFVPTSFTHTTFSVQTRIVSSALNRLRSLAPESTDQRREQVKASTPKRLTFAAETFEKSSSLMDAKPADDLQGPKKRSYQNGHGPGGRLRKKMKKAKDADWPEGSHEEILALEIEDLLEDLEITTEDRTLPELQSPIDIKITHQSSTGDGLGIHTESQTVFVVPFSVPGDVVTAKPYRFVKESSHFLADFVKVSVPSEQRSDELVKCQYFGRCGGCQFQMLPYQHQLEHKKLVVERAYRHFSGLAPDLIPVVEPTLESPRQYGYRTKLTPHFDAPPGGKRAKKNREGPLFTEVPDIGFMLKGTRKTLDIEDCPIGTDVLRQAIPTEKKRVADTLHTFKNGATLLLRESTERKLKSKFDPDAVRSDQVVEEHEKFNYIKTCITDPKATSKEYVGDRILLNPAGFFFQNNNSILQPFISYIRSLVTPSDTEPKLPYLVDAYCGSGLFTITLSDIFRKSIGIDISDSSITFARKNARLNNLPENQATFLSADAANIFAKIEFLADETVVVIDPPRKGCDKNFLGQLLKFAPRKVVYVSCNVHTQARDVGVLVNGMEGVGEGRYVLEKLRGMDFFPQTHHVEGLAILRRKE